MNDRAGYLAGLAPFAAAGASNDLTDFASILPFAWLNMIRSMSGLPFNGARSSKSMISPGRNGFRYMPLVEVTRLRCLPSPLSYQS